MGSSAFLTLREEKKKIIISEYRKVVAKPVYVEGYRIVWDEEIFKSVSTIPKTV